LAPIESFLLIINSNLAPFQRYFTLILGVFPLMLGLCRC